MSYRVGVMFFWGDGRMDAFALLYYVKIRGLRVRRIDVCGYEYGYGWKI